MTEKEKCVPCEGGDVVAMTPEEAQGAVQHIPEWQIRDDNKAILRNYKLKNFAIALQLVNDIGAIAEEQGHHPDITFGWGYVDVLLQTHAIDGLHQNDFIVATEIEEVASALS